MKQCISTNAFFITFLICTQPTAAATDIHWSGFLSVVAGRTLDDGTLYNTGYIGYDGTYSDRLKFNPESILGLQGLMPINDKLRATVQLVGRGGQSFDADIEWAYVTYQINDEVSVNAGRLRLPLYYYSDFLDVGKAYYWIRPPAKAYNGPARIDGTSIFYDKAFERFDVSALVWVGSEETEAPGDLTFDFYNNIGATLSLGQQWWNLRAVYGQGDIDVYTNSNLVVDSSTMVPAGSILAKTFVTLTGIAASMDIENWRLRSEFVTADSDQDKPANVWYISTAYTFGAYTPHITYTDSDENTAANLIDSTEVTLGIAWDFNPNSVLKFEYIKETPDNPSIDTIELLSIGLDVVF